jgi:hypothetical protein
MRILVTIRMTSCTLEPLLNDALPSASGVLLHVGLKKLSLLCGVPCNACTHYFMCLLSGVKR